MAFGAHVSVAGATTTSARPFLAPPPAGYSVAQRVFDTDFAGRALPASWNSYITSKAANGWPWNANGSGGSGVANASVRYDSEYDIPAQVRVNGLVKLVASRAPITGMIGSSPAQFPWRSAAMSTYGHFQFTGGFVQIDAKMPAGSGMWPGLWMLPGPGGSGGDNFELDIFEGGYTGGGSPAHNFAWHLHTPSGTAGGQTVVGPDLTAGYHEYGVDWLPGKSVTWYLDGVQVGRVTSAQVPIPTEPMELIMDLQVASPSTAGWHTLPNASTPARNVMSVRSVEVFR